MSTDYGNELTPALEHEPDDAPYTYTPDMPPPKKIAAEVFFDKAVYGGISYAAQAGTGIVLSHWIKHGNGQKYYKDFLKWVTGNDVKNVSTTAIVTLMIMVGNTFLIPVKMLENKKPKIVRWLTDWMNEKQEAKGQPISKETRNEQESRLYYLEHHAPKQSWWSLGSGRAFGLGVVYATDFLIGEKNNVRAQEFAAKTIQKGMGTVGFTKIAQSKTIGYYLRIGFIDAFYSAISAGGLYVYSHYINPPKRHGIPEIPAVDSDAAEETLPALALPVIGKHEQKTYAHKIHAAHTGERKNLLTPPENLYTGKIAATEPPSISMAV